MRWNLKEGGGYLWSDEQKEYAEVFDYSKITEKSGVITDYWTDNLLDDDTQNQRTN